MTRPIRRNLTLVVFCKEITEIFSDRRTLFAAILTPVLIIPLLMVLSGVFVQNQQKTQIQTTYKIGLIDPSASPLISKYLKSQPNLIIAVVTRGESDALITKRDLKAAIILAPETDQILSNGKTAHITILHDPGNDVSNDATQRVESALNQFAGVIRDQRLKQKGLPIGFAKPITFDEVATQGGGTMTMFLLAMFIPYVLALSAFSGGMTAANDQIAGEKERGTLETLLVSPATKREIVIGKFCAVASVCLTSGFLSVLGLVIPLSIRGVGLFPGMSSVGGLKLDLSGVFLIALAQIPIALLFSGLLIAVSAFSRNPKEASTYQGPLLMLILVPALGTMFASTDQPLSTALVPILNSTMVIKQVLVGVHDIKFISISILSSTIYAIIGIVIATRIFESETILLKS